MLRDLKGDAVRTRVLAAVVVSLSMILGLLGGAAQAEPANRVASGVAPIAAGLAGAGASGSYVVTGNWDHTESWDPQQPPDGRDPVWGDLNVTINVPKGRLGDVWMVYPELVDLATKERRKMVSQMCPEAGECHLKFSSVGAANFGVANLPVEADHSYYVDVRFKNLAGVDPEFRYVSQPHETLVAMPNVPDEQSGPCSVSCQGFSLDPVNTATGAFFMSFEDLPQVGPGVPLGLSRTYGSLSTRNTGFGRGWSWLYGTSLKVGADEVAWYAPDGTTTRFTKKDGAWVTPPGSPARLESTSSGYLIRLRGGYAFRFDADGALTSVIDQAGVGVTVVQSNGVVSKVTNSVGRSLTFSSAVRVQRSSVKSTR